MNFTPAPTSNQLNTITGTLNRTYGYDLAGNTTSYSNFVFTYNNRGRINSLTDGTTTTSYIYSALGQMIKKTVGSAVTVLVYDEAGHVLGEYTNAGGLIQETIWMGDIPVATIRPNPSTGCSTGTVCIFYIHTDQLNAPRKISQPSTGTLAWRWDTDPFGTTAPNQNPGKLGAFKYNLRFPGQYYQSETGLNYNYFRDYDPQTGRYIESDPIGLYGRSVYAYAAGNPLSNIDPLGLLTLSIGYTGSSVLGFGGNVGGGVYFNYSGGQINVGTYVSGGAGVGLNVSAGVQFGAYSGDLQTFSGRTNAVSGGTEAINGGIVYNTSGDIVGFTTTIGPTLSPINYSATAEVTGITSKSTLDINTPAACH